VSAVIPIGPRGRPAFIREDRLLDAARDLAGGGKPAPERLVELVSGYLEAEIRLGRVRLVDPLPLARALFGGCVDHVRSRAAARPYDTDDAFVLGLVDVVLSGLTPPPTSP